MPFIATSAVETADNRQRREFDPSKMVELGDSIQNPNIGLLHPIVLRELNGKHILVAGERRLRAVCDSHDLGVLVYHAGLVVPPGQIPYVSLGKMAPLDAWEAELEENVRRVDLTWQEKAEATNQLMNLRNAQAAAQGKKALTTADLAMEVHGKSEGAYQDELRKDILLAGQMKIDPEVAGAKSKAEAVKIMKRKEESARNVRLAAEVGKTFSSSSHTLLNTDSREWAVNQPEGTYDVILTDPPYGMGADEFGDSGGKSGGGHLYDDDPEVLSRILTWLPAETFRLAKPEAHLYVFCDIDWFNIMRQLFVGAGWRVFRTPLVWVKPSAYRAPWPDEGPQRKYELCLYATKGGRKTRRLAPDVVTYPPDENLGHQAQKPVALYQDLLSRSVNPGDKVLDLFCGTGPIFPAAHELKCSATGLEIDPASYGIATTRVKELK